VTTRYEYVDADADRLKVTLETGDKNWTVMLAVSRRTAGGENMQWAAVEMSLEDTEELTGQLLAIIAEGRRRREGVAAEKVNSF
jgi:hypothetical protein